MSARVLAVTTILLAAVSPFLAAPAHAATAEERAWSRLEAGIQSKKLAARVPAVRALGLVPNNLRARKLAESALQDLKPEVRVAAAAALGQMQANASIPLLKELTSDKDLSVALAAAHALYVLKNPEGYELYYAVLTGRRKGGQGLIADQMQTLHDPAKMATLGLEQAIGYVPFAGIGWDALRTIMKKDSSPARAVAASLLAQDPDPATGQALVDAANDKNWIVRVAALDAIARRGDADLEVKIEPLLEDEKRQVRYTAAAAFLRLSAIAARQSRKKN
jgi:HEAT repeat protein